MFKLSLTIDYVVKSAFLRHQKEDQQHQQDPEEDKADMENAWSAEYRFITDLGKQPDEVSTTENKC
jgi:hypothetical protein